MDAELIQGARLEVEYEVKLINNNEIDYDNVVKVKSNLKDLCPICNENYKSITSEMCEKCWSEKRSLPKVKKEELELLVYKIPFTEVAKQFDVSAKTIRRWCKTYGLPTNNKEKEHMKPIETN